MMDYWRRESASTPLDEGDEKQGATTSSTTARHTRPLLTAHRSASSPHRVALLRAGPRPPIAASPHSPVKYLPLCRSKRGVVWGEALPAEADRSRVHRRDLPASPSSSFSSLPEAGPCRARSQPPQQLTVVPPRSLPLSSSLCKSTMAAIPGGPPPSYNRDDFLMEQFRAIAQRYEISDFFAKKLKQLEGFEIVVIWSVHATFTLSRFSGSMSRLA
jgi:hypothetical protein